MKIAFDIDSTLIEKNTQGLDVPRHDILDLLRWFQTHGHHIIIWSGGGVDYAKQWAEKLGINATILTKDEYHNADISVDDEEVSLAKVNIRV